MSKVSYLSGWQPDLCIQLITANNDKVDFNRFLIKHFPTTAQLQQDVPPGGRNCRWYAQNNPIC